MKKRARQLKLPGQGDPQTRWLMAHFLVTLLVLWGWQELFQQFAVRTIPYSQFKAHLERHEVIDVTVKQDEIVAAGRAVDQCRARRAGHQRPQHPHCRGVLSFADSWPLVFLRGLLLHHWLSSQAPCWRFKSRTEADG